MRRIPCFAWLYLLTTLSCFPLLVQGQESLHLLEKNNYYPSPSENYSEGLYGVALAQSEDIAFLDEWISIQAQSALELDETRSIDLLLESIARTNSDEEKNAIRLSIGNKYFDRKEYDLAHQFYAQINHTYLDQIHDQSVQFKLGYIALMNKDFVTSAKHFEDVTATVGNYTRDGYYYLGINQYYLDQVEDAIKSFEKVENESRYRDLIPYYLTQIYFKDQRYDEVIKYCEQRLEQPNLRNRNQINKMLGLSYLAQGSEVDALDYLDAYASETSKLSENEFYQLGYLHFKHGNRMQAVGYLKQLAHQDSQIGQMANYLLGSISLNQGNKQEARSAFKQSSKYTYFKDIKNESEFLYYKLAADLGEERTAINGLAGLEVKHPYYDDSQKLLSQLLVRTDDYAAAITTIEGFSQKSPEIVSAYQALCYDYGQQLAGDGREVEALNYFKTASDTPGSDVITKESQFWTGFLLDQKGDYLSSRSYLDKYLGSGKGQHTFKAHYLLAYQDIGEQDYKAATTHLEQAMQTHNPHAPDETALLNDALTRLADLRLVDNDYESALRYYDLAIDNGALKADYIIYQKGLIYGVNGRPYDKLTTLETLIKSHPDSEYRDDALFEVGESMVALEKNNEAYKIFESLASLYPNSSYVPKCHMRMGLISFNHGDMEAALQAYKQGLRTSDNNEDQREALITIEEIYLNNLNDSEAYFSYLENEIGFKYEDITKDSIAFQVAYESYKEGNYEKAIGLFDNYQNKYGDGFFVDDSYYFEAESYVLLKHYSKGLDNYESVMTVAGSEYHDFALKKAAVISYNHEENFSKSLRYYGELIKVSGSSSLEYVEPAMYSAAQLDDTGAVEQYAKIVSEHADAEPELKSTANFYLGQVFQRQNKMDEAIRVYNLSARDVTSHQTAEAHYQIAKIFYDRAQYDNAEAQAFEATKRGVNYPFWVAKSLILLGDIYQQKNDFLNATAAYESVIENFKDNVKLSDEAKAKLSDLNARIKNESKVKSKSELEFMDQDTLKF